MTRPLMNLIKMKTMLNMSRKLQLRCVKALDRMGDNAGEHSERTAERICHQTITNIGLRNQSVSEADLVPNRGQALVWGHCETRQGLRLANRSIRRRPGVLEDETERRKGSLPG